MCGRAACAAGSCAQQEAMEKPCIENDPMEGVSYDEQSQGTAEVYQ